MPAVPMISVTDAATRYADRTAQSGQRWQEGAARTDVDPTSLAAAAAQKALTNYSAAITSGRFARRLAEVGKQGWLAGVNRPEAVTAYTAGTAGKGRAKWAAAMNTWFPIFSQLQAQIAGMPSTTPQDSINRVAAWINGTIAAKQQL